MFIFLYFQNFFYELVVDLAIDNTNLSTHLGLFDWFL